MWEKHKTFWSQKLFAYNALIGIVFLAVALIANHYANSYATAQASNNVTDIFLNNLPVVDVRLIFSEGAMLFLLFLAAVLLYEPRYLSFTLKSLAVFVLIRSFFLILTNLAPPADQILVSPTDFISSFSSGGDFFFSAHTGLPFLLAFIFWDKKLLRCIFFISSVVGGAIVLLGHLHYSIDVFSAFFISFAVFHVCKNLFPKDYKLTINQA